MLGTVLTIPEYASFVSSYIKEIIVILCFSSKYIVVKELVESTERLVEKH